jgi:hypothetical protein
MNEKVLVGPKFGTLIYRKWITNIWVVTHVVSQPVGSQRHGACQQGRRLVLANGMAHYTRLIIQRTTPSFF